jgi:chromosome segregation protein
VLERLGAEEEALREEGSGADEREIETRIVFQDATARLGASEEALSKLTAERADASATRAQLERSQRDTAERRDRLHGQLAGIDRELAELEARIAALPDPAHKREEAEGVQEALEAAEERAMLAEEAVALARERETQARAPLQEARAALAGIETEARTLARIINAVSGDLFPAVLEQIRVERGYETALGAALGEDLDVPLDRNAPAHWDEMAPAPDDPELPQGVQPLAGLVRAPDQLARRLAQIGIVAPEDGARLQKLLRPGQRLVSREGALWRWDGYRASADAPTAAAQRLASSPDVSAGRACEAGWRRGGCGGRP